MHVRIQRLMQLKLGAFRIFPREYCDGSLQHEFEAVGLRMEPFTSFDAFLWTVINCWSQRVSSHGLN